MSSGIKAIVHLTFPKYPRYGFVRYMCNNHWKELVKPTIVPNTDVLLQNFKSSDTPKNVLNLVARHNKIMNSKHVIQALRTIYELQKNGTSDLSAEELLRNPNFETICRQLKRNAGVIDIQETMDALKCICYLGAPSDSLIVQVLLQLIRQNINFLTLPNIMFLQYLLHHFKSTPLVDALKIALPLVFDINLPVKMDRNNVDHLTDYLMYASRVELSNRSIEIIVNSLSECKTEFNAYIAKSIIWSITNMDPNPFFEPLLKKAIQNLVLHLDELSYTDMETTLTKLTHKYSRKFQFYYNELFFDCCANYIIDKDLGYKPATFLLRKLHRVHFFSKSLLDYMSSKAIENPEYILNGEASEIYSIVTSIALTDYKPVRWDSLKNLILGIKDLAKSTNRKIIWIKFASALCLLDIYKVDVLIKALNIEYLDRAFKKKFMTDFEGYLTIWNSITMYRPEMQDILPSQYEPERILDDLKPIPDFPLEGALQAILGGETYVKTNIFSKNGHQIDHAILFRKGGYPVALPTEPIHLIEDIEVPADNTLVLIMCLRAIHYTINNKHMREPVRLFMKILESKGYSVVPVCLEVWDSLNDFEKIPFLMQQINSKVNCGFSVSESVV